MSVPVTAVHDDLVPPEIVSTVFYSATVSDTHGHPGRRDRRPARRASPGCNEGAVQLLGYGLDDLRAPAGRAAVPQPRRRRAQAAAAPRARRAHDAAGPHRQRRASWSALRRRPPRRPSGRMWTLRMRLHLQRAGAGAARHRRRPRAPLLHPDRALAGPDPALRAGHAAGARQRRLLHPGRAAGPSSCSAPAGSTPSTPTTSTHVIEQVAAALDGGDGRDPGAAGPRRRRRPDDDHPLRPPVHPGRRRRLRRHDRGHHRPAGLRGAAGPPGQPRPADRPAQPHAAGRVRRRAVPPGRQRPGLPLPRPGQLQGRQRLPRPRRRRRAARRGGRAAARHRAPRRPGRPLRRRRVRRRLRGRRRGRRRGARRADRRPPWPSRCAWAGSTSARTPASASPCRPPSTSPPTS